MFWFFSCTPFSSTYRSQLPFAQHQPLRDYFGCSTKSWCLTVQFRIIFSPFHLPLGLCCSPSCCCGFPCPSRSCFSHLSIAQVLWLLGWRFHICVACFFWLLLVLSRSGDRATMNMMVVLAVKNMKNLSQLHSGQKPFPAMQSSGSPYTSIIAVSAVFWSGIFTDRSSIDFKALFAL